MLIFFLARFAHSKLWKLVNFRTFCAEKLFKDFIFFICRIREVQFSELVKGICHLSAARRQTGHKNAVFWSVKNWIWSGKSQWKVREFCFCMRVATLYILPVAVFSYLSFNLEVKAFAVVEFFLYIYIYTYFFQPFKIILLILGWPINLKENHMATHKQNLAFALVVGVKPHRCSGETPSDFIVVGPL